MNVVPGIGDHINGIFMIGGVMTARYNVQKTGKGDYVTLSLLHSSIFCQAIPIQAAQYKGLGQVYPISRKTADNPFNNTYKSKDGRHIQISMPPFDVFYPKFMPLIGRADLVGNERYKIANITENKLNGEFVQILEEAFALKTVGEWGKILTEGDIPFSVCQLWEEVLEDKQAWAAGVFEEVDYPTGKRTMVRQPIAIKGADVLPYGKGPMLAEHSEEIIKELGYTDAQLKELHAAGVYSTWDDVRDYVMSQA
jgi:cinnamoyl-CoA:phenyllactate CoA-transferase